MPSITISNVASVVLSRNRLRKSFSIQNEDGTDICYLKRERADTLTVSSTDHDFKIGPNAGVSLNSFLDGAETIQDQWSIIASANTPRIAVIETEDVTR